MKLNTLFIITSIVALIFGLAFILAPIRTMSLYGVTLDRSGEFLGRYLGAAFIGFAFLAWLSRNANLTVARNEVVSGFFVTTVLGFVVSVYDKFAGTGNILVWLNVIIYLLLAVGFGYYRFAKVK